MALFRFACLGEAVSLADLPMLQPDVLENSHAAGLLEAVGELRRLNIRFVPYNGRGYVADPLDGPRGPQGLAIAPAYVGLLTHQQLAFLRARLPARPGGALLEMGCGTGLLAIDMAGHFETVTGSEVYDRSLSYAVANARLNAIPNITLIESDLFKSVQGSFDQIVFNPWQPTEDSLDVVGSFLAEIPQRLRPGGSLLLVVTSSMRQGVEPVMSYIEARLDQHQLVGSRWIIESWLDRSSRSVDSLNFLEIGPGRGRPTLRTRVSGPAMGWRSRATVAAGLW